MESMRMAVKDGPSSDTSNSSLSLSGTAKSNSAQTHRRESEIYTEQKPSPPNQSVPAEMDKAAS